VDVRHQTRDPQPHRKIATKLTAISAPLYIMATTSKLEEKAGSSAYHPVLISSIADLPNFSTHNGSWHAE
jgi:hypothetical protein